MLTSITSIICMVDEMSNRQNGIRRTGTNPNLHGGPQTHIHLGTGVPISTGSPNLYDTGIWMPLKAYWFHHLGVNPTNVHSSYTWMKGRGSNLDSAAYWIVHLSIWFHRSSLLPVHLLIHSLSNCQQKEADLTLTCVDSTLTSTFTTVDTLWFAFIWLAYGGNKFLEWVQYCRKIFSGGNQF